MPGLCLIYDNRIVVADVAMFCLSAQDILQTPDIACRGKIMPFTNRLRFNITMSTYRKTDKNKKICFWGLTFYCFLTIIKIVQNHSHKGVARILR